MHENSPHDECLQDLPLSAEIAARVGVHTEDDVGIACLSLDEVGVVQITNDSLDFWRDFRHPFRFLLISYEASDGVIASSVGEMN